VALAGIQGGLRCPEDVNGLIGERNQQHERMCMLLLLGSAFPTPDGCRSSMSYLK